MRWIALGIAAGYALCALAILSLRWINPLTTSVQIERRVEALIAHRPYTRRYRFVPLSRISPDGGKFMDDYTGSIARTRR